MNQVLATRHEETSFCKKKATKMQISLNICSLISIFIVHFEISVMALLSFLKFQEGVVAQW